MKQPNWKVPFVLSFTLLVFGSFTYWLQFSHKPKKERIDSENKKPLPYSADTSQIAHIRIKSAQGVIELHCDSLDQKTCKPEMTGKWSVSYPEKLPGDADAVKDFLNNATAMLAAETIDLSEESEDKRKKLMEEYGLSDSRRTSMGTEFVEFTLDDGKKVAAWFGEPHPVGDKIFVGSAINGSMNDQTIFLIANFYKNTLFGKSLTNFRDKSLFQVKREDVTAFEAKTTFGKLQANLVNGLWTVNQLPADYDRVETLLAAISQSKAKEFPQEAELKGAKSVVSYTLHSKTGDLHFELLEKTSGKSLAHTYLRSPSLKQAVEVEPLLKSQLDRKLTELRKNLLLTETEKVTATVLKLEGKAYPTPAEFHFDGKAWVSKNTDQKWDTGKASALLDLLATAHSTDIVSPAPSQGGDTVTLSLGDEKNPNRTRFAIYTAKDKAYARDLNAKVNEAFVVAPSIKNSFPFSPESWKLK